MTQPDLFSRIFGCMVGNSIGDAYGAVAEFFVAERMQRTLGTQWLEDYLPYSPRFPHRPLRRVAGWPAAWDGHRRHAQ